MPRRWLAEGVELTICARTADVLEATAAEIRKAYGVKVTAVACDVTTEEGRKAILAACPNPDILINNAGGPPPGDFKDFSLDDWRAAVEGNMITPIALIHSTVYGMMDRGFGRILNITSYSVKSPIRDARTFERCACRLDWRRFRICRDAPPPRTSRSTPCCPDPSRPTVCAGPRPRWQRSKGHVVRRRCTTARKKEVPAGRFGTTTEFGAAAAFLCSAHAGFITGQNLVLDGGFVQ